MHGASRFFLRTDNNNHTFRHQFIDTCPNVVVVEMMEAFHSFLKNSPMMAYLAMMAPRLVELLIGFTLQPST